MLLHPMSTIDTIKSHYWLLLVIKIVLHHVLYIIINEQRIYIYKRLGLPLTHLLFRKLVHGKLKKRCFILSENKSAAQR